MTTIENTEATESSESTENVAVAETPTEPTVKYPTYAELVRATWKLAFEMSSRGDSESFDYCVAGTNEFLTAFELPTLGDVEDLERADDYVDAWLRFKHWRATGELSPEDDAALRSVLERTIRATLAHKEPSSREVMNEWLRDLGLTEIKPPRRRRGYDIGVRLPNNEYLRANVIRDVLNAAMPGIDAEVTYY